jgi:uncharacterized protein with FMN-binding domain
MKKIVISGIVVVGFVLYAIFGRKILSVNSPSSATSESDSTATGSSQLAYKDGSYTGIPSDAFYGTIQVKAIIANGKISNVQFLQYPHDQATSVQVNKQAMPLLKQEAIQAQNAKVDVVSGATQTSQAFKESLASALTQAK